MSHHIFTVESISKFLEELNNLEIEVIDMGAYWRVVLEEQTGSEIGIPKDRAATKLIAYIRVIYDLNNDLAAQISENKNLA